jgi:hypothetical protein
MPRRCLTCIHHKRRQIEWEIIKGVPYTTIAKKYDTSYDSLYAHARTHLKQNLIKKAKEEESELYEHIIAFIKETLSSAPQVEYHRLVKASNDLNETMA